MSSVARAEVKKSVELLGGLTLKLVIVAPAPMSTPRANRFDQSSPESSLSAAREAGAREGAVPAAAAGRAATKARPIAIPMAKAVRSWRGVTPACRGERDSLDIVRILPEPPFDEEWFPLRAGNTARRDPFGSSPLGLKEISRIASAV